MMQMRMAMMAPVPKLADATAPSEVQSPCSSQGHTLTLIMERFVRGGLPESETRMGTRYIPASRYGILSLS